MRLPFTRRDESEAIARLDLRRRALGGDSAVFRDVGDSAQFQEQLSDFWSSTYASALGANPRLLDNVWSANRCIQLNSQQIATMPLRFYGTREPAWVSNPDPNWFPNGISSAIFAATKSLYGWGDAFLYVTSRYSDGFPSGWTVLDPEPMSIRVIQGEREYKYRNTVLDPRSVCQITRNPGGVRGTSALRAYGSTLVSSIASSDVSRAINEGGIPNAVLKANRKITDAQAEAIQQTWATRATVRRGLPAVLPPEIDFQPLSFSPADLMLLDLQQFDARVIASAFGVPPAMLNMPLEGGLTYQNPAQMIESWWRNELRPVAKLVADALSAQMLPRGSWVEFDARDALAPDFKDLVESWLALLAQGVTTVDEVRAAVLRLPPQSEQESLDDIITPSSSATSGVTQSPTVVQLRPTSEVGRTGGPVPRMQLKPPASDGQVMRALRKLLAEFDESAEVG